MANMGLIAVLIARLYAGDVLSEQDQQHAVETAHAILLAAQIPTTWPPCAIACNHPLQPGEVAIRVVRDGGRAQSPNRVALGYSLIDRREGAGVLATVYLDRVTRVAAEAGVDARVVLGRAIAHEIGHLLLGHTGHSSAGVMRPVWTRAMLERNAPADWLFAPADAAQLRDAFSRRLHRRSEVTSSVFDGPPNAVMLASDRPGRHED